MYVGFIITPAFSSLFGIPIYAIDHHNPQLVSWFHHPSNSGGKARREGSQVAGPSFSTLEFDLHNPQPVGPVAPGSQSKFRVEVPGSHPPAMSQILFKVGAPGSQAGPSTSRGKARRERRTKGRKQPYQKPSAPGSV
jgi:hypothetical protein